MSNLPTMASRDLYNQWSQDYAITFCLNTHIQNRYDKHKQLLILIKLVDNMFSVSETKISAFVELYKERPDLHVHAILKVKDKKNPREYIYNLFRLHSKFINMKRIGHELKPVSNYNNWTNYIIKDISVMRTVHNMNSTLRDDYLLKEFYIPEQAEKVEPRLMEHSDSVHIAQPNPSESFLKVNKKKSVANSLLTKKK